MSRVVNNNRGFLQLLAACPAYQRQFLLKTATPQQLHALVQVLYNLLMGHIPISEENKRVLLPYKDALLNMASPNVPFKTKKRVLVQEGSDFIEDVLAPVLLSDLIEKEKGYQNVENISDNQSNNEESSSDIENQEEEEEVASENGVEAEDTQESDNDTENDSQEIENSNPETSTTFHSKSPCEHCENSNVYGTLIMKCP
ncbi:unnamed protein product, partial [Porites evermanni]